jgi:hypothetical protein
MWLVGISGVRGLVGQIYNVNWLVYALRFTKLLKLWLLMLYSKHICLVYMTVFPLQSYFQTHISDYKYSTDNVIAVFCYHSDKWMKGLNSNNFPIKKHLEGETRLQVVSRRLYWRYVIRHRSFNPVSDLALCITLIMNRGSPPYSQSSHDIECWRTTGLTKGMRGF